MASGLARPQRRRRSWLEDGGHGSCKVLRVTPETDEETVMMNLLWAVAVVLFVLWILGFTLHFSMGGLIHVLLVLAILSIIARLVMGRRRA
jgi:hypothetical protein